MKQTTWLWIAGGVLVIGGIGSIIDPPKGANTTEARSVVPKTGPPGAAPQPAFRVIGGPDVFAMITPPDMSADAIALAAKGQCGRREFCQVHAWASAIDAAQAFPMTDREAAAQVFVYGVNRSTGYEQLLWDCRRFRRRSANECISH
jgi:hypothetical protein